MLLVISSFSSAFALYYGLLVDNSTFILINAVGIVFWGLYIIIYIGVSTSKVSSFVHVSLKHILRHTNMPLLSRLSHFTKYCHCLTSRRLSCVKKNNQSSVWHETDITHNQVILTNSWHDHTYSRYVYQSTWSLILLLLVCLLLPGRYFLLKVFFFKFRLYLFLPFGTSLNLSILISISYLMFDLIT